MSSDTQLQAYAAIKESKAAILCVKVLNALKLNPDGMTSEKIAKFLNLDYASIQPRTSELHAELKIFDNGQRGLNSSGKKAIIWKLVTTPEERETAIKQNIKKMKPIGDAKLFGEMMRAIYAYEAWECPANEEKLEFALITWAMGMKHQIRKAKHHEI